MADPTDYDKVQDSRLDDIEDIVTSSAEAGDGIEQSFPIEGDPMSGEQWAHLAKAWGSGVISYGGAPYRISDVDDVNNTLVINAADDEGRESGAVLEGYAHRMKGNVELSVAAVPSSTDYVIGLQFDPLRDSMPIKLGVFSRPLDTSQGKKYIPIWEGTRKSSSALSSVTWNTARSRISPTTTVARESRLPDPRHSGLMWGTICYTYRDRQWFQLQWADEEGGEMVWVKISQEWSEWTNPGDTATYEWAGHGYRRGWRSDGRSAELRGRVQKVDGTQFINGGGGDGGYLMYSLPEAARPKGEVRLITASSGTTNQRLVVANISSNGEVRLQPILGDCQWMSLDGLRWPLD